MAVNADADPPIVITFGTEHEFIARPRNPLGPFERHLEPQRTLAEVADVINSVKVPGVRIKAVVDFQPSDDEADSSDEKPNSSINPPDSSVWRVKVDGSLIPEPIHPWEREATEEEKAMAATREYTELEVVSCAFSAGEGAVWDVVIPKVLAALAGAFYLTNNETTSTHVHLGTGLPISTQLPPEEGRKLGVFVVVYERQMDDLHADHRLRSKYCKSNSFNSFFGKAGLAAKIAAIKRARDIPHLVEIMCPEGRDYKVNFHSLLQYPYTVEFRQCEGTLDAGKICKWVRFLIALRQLLAPLTLDEVIERFGGEHPPELWDISDLKKAWYGPDA